MRVDGRFLEDALQLAHLGGRAFKQANRHRRLVQANAL